MHTITYPTNDEHTITYHQVGTTKGNCGLLCWLLSGGWTIHLSDLENDMAALYFLCL